jgi:zona occludens toxin
MINLLLGRPGAGKSYEAVAFHVIPAVLSGRRVITNLPLNIDHFAAVYGEQCRELIIILLPYKGNKIRFQQLIDYADPWKHEETGVGPLYVIDECHFALRRGGTHQDVEEWYSMHRHENADLLLMSQSHGKIDKNILEMVQLLYRVSKKTAWGDDDHYIRKVFDGLKGGEMNLSTREYEPKYFPFYQSHTKSGSSAEAQASDVVTFWKSPIMRGSLILLLIGFGSMGFVAYKAFATDDVQKTVKQIAPAKPKPTYQDLSAKFDSIKSDRQVAKGSIPPAGLTSPPQPKPKPVDLEPYSKFTIAVVGSFKVRDKTSYLFEAQQNGQVAFSISEADIILAGYSIVPLNPCAAYLIYKETKRPITCQFAQVSTVTASQITEG